MSLLDTLKAKLEPELFAQVTDALGDDFDYDLVTRARLNAVIGQREAAKRAAARQQLTQAEEPAQPDNSAATILAALVQALGGEVSSVGLQSNPPQVATAPGQSVESMQILTKEQQDQAIQAEVQKQVNQVKQQYALTEKLRVAGVVDPDLVLKGGLLDMSKLMWAEDNPSELKSGLDEQLTAMKESRAYLFQQSSPVAGGIVGTGREGIPGSVGTINSMADLVKLPMEQQMAFKQAHPEVVQGFMMQAGLADLISKSDN